ncbi:hypothetical protein J3F84DRAFT_170867 [Trichoderma pleuroticola]
MSCESLGQFSDIWDDDWIAGLNAMGVITSTPNDLEESTGNDLSVDVCDNDYLGGPEYLKISDIPPSDGVLEDQKHPAAPESVVLVSSFEVTPPLLGDSVNRMVDSAKPVRCQICLKSYGATRSLTRHLKTHSPERPYSCKLCPSKFKRSDLLTRHLRRHSSEKPFACDCCLKTFSTRDGLKRHSRYEAAFCEPSLKY